MSWSYLGKSYDHFVTYPYTITTLEQFYKLLYLDSVNRVLREATNLDCVWNAMAHALKPDFVFRRNGRVHLNQRGRQFTRLLAAELCASAVVMLDTPRCEVVWRVLATHSIRQFPLHFSSRASPCAITFQLDSTFVMLRVFCSSVFITKIYIHLPLITKCHLIPTEVKSRFVHVHAMQAYRWRRGIAPIIFDVALHLRFRFRGAGKASASVVEGDGNDVALP
jgi:hypothetical protein